MPVTPARLARFLGHPRAERSAALQAVVLLAAARLGLRYATVPATRRGLARVARSSGVPPLRLSEIVSAASQVLPGPSACLPRALVLESMLTAAGAPAELRIGLSARNGKAAPSAHAWVDLAGTAVAEDVSRFTPLPIFGARG
jgi:hypothetical protein